MTAEGANPDTVLLLQRYRGGDDAALNDLVRRFYPRVERMVRVRVGARLERRVGVEDLVQETFLRALRSLDDFELRPDGRLIDWFARLAEREVLNAAQHHGRAKRQAREVSYEAMRAAVQGSTISFDLVADSTPPPVKVADRELEAIVDECLAGLGPQQREVILLHDYAGQDWPSIAQALERPTVGAAQQLYARARRSLAESVARRT